MCRGVCEGEEPIMAIRRHMGCSPPSVFGHAIWPIAGGWIGECQGMSTRWWAMTTAPMGLQPAPSSPTESAWYPVSMSHSVEVPLESWWRRGCILAEGGLRTSAPLFARGLANGRCWKRGGIEGIYSMYSTLLYTSLPHLHHMAHESVSVECYYISL
jgi:hypothetical protein